MRIADRSRPSIPPRSAFAGFRFPPDVIVVAVRWYLRFGLSDRDVEELLTERGVEVDHVTVYRWVLRFTPLLADAAQPCRHRVGDRWQVDETYVKVAGQWRYVYRTIDQFGQVIDVYVSSWRDTKTAHRFVEQAIGTTKIAPPEVITDKSPVYPAVLEELLPAAWHRTDRYANNRVECDHGRPKARLRPMRGLKQDRSARVVIAGHAFVQNLRRGHYELAVEEPTIGDWWSRSTNWSWRSDPAEVAQPALGRRNATVPAAQPGGGVLDPAQFGHAGLWSTQSRDVERLGPVQPDAQHGRHLPWSSQMSGRRGGLMDSPRRTIPSMASRPVCEPRRGAVSAESSTGTRTKSAPGEGSQGT